MFTNLRMDQVFLACGPTDLRKSVDGLVAIVQESFQLDPLRYLTYVPLIDVTEEAALDALDALMPWSDKIPTLKELHR